MAPRQPSNTRLSAELAGGPSVDLVPYGVDMAQVVVDGRELEVAGDAMLLGALGLAGISVPSLCDDPRLVPVGECRMCLVEIEGRPQPVSACTTPVTDGMVVHSATAELESVRKGLLEMMARHYPAPAVAAYPEKPLHQLFLRYDVAASGREGDDGRRDDSHPCIAVDMNRCIDCFRCVRICDEVQGQFVWQIAGPGHAPRRSWPVRASLGRQSLCGVRCVCRHLPDWRARGSLRRRARPRPDALDPDRRAPTAAWAASCWSAPATSTIVTVSPAPRRAR